MVVDRQGAVPQGLRDVAMCVGAPPPGGGVSPPMHPASSQRPHIKCDLPCPTRPTALPSGGTTGGRAAPRRGREHTPTTGLPACLTARGEHAAAGITGCWLRRKGGAGQRQVLPLWYVRTGGSV